MLQGLLNLLESQPNHLTQDQICSSLGIRQESLQVILDILVHKGRLRLIPLPEDSSCATACTDCPVLMRCPVINHTEILLTIDPLC